MRLGLASVSYREKSVEEIVAMMGRAGLGIVEWGSDVHVPHGDIEKAVYVRRLCADENVRISSYGSYFFLGDGMDISPFLDSAAALGADRIRIWAGRKGSSMVDGNARKKLVDEALKIKERASSYGIRLFWEYHRNTLTDTAESAMELIGETGIASYWQPNPELLHSERLKELSLLKDTVEIVHVFSWIREEENDVRMPLDAEEWKSYVGVLGTDRTYLLEFLCRQDPETLERDVYTMAHLVCKPAR